MAGSIASQHVASSQQSGYFPALLLAHNQPAKSHPFGPQKPYYLLTNICVAPKLNYTKLLPPDLVLKCGKKSFIESKVHQEEVQRTLTDLDDFLYRTYTYKIVPGTWYLVILHNMKKFTIPNIQY